MERDALKIRQPQNWPLGDRLRMKTQPWVTEAANGRIRFGEIRNHLHTVHVEGGAVEEFDSLEELVAVWSVD